MEQIAEGAEAQIFKVDDGVLKKLRVPKPYRLEVIDKKLRKSRNNREFKILTKLHETKVNVPEPIELIQDDEEIAFTFEYINGNLLKSIIDEKLLNKAFKQIILMHKQDITHNDLTTLNMIEKKGEIYLIDFGLANFSTKIEDKAVDLNLFFNCIKNEHPLLYCHKNKLETLYKQEIEQGESIIKRLKQIEHRGRNK